MGRKLMTIHIFGNFDKEDTWRLIHLHIPRTTMQSNGQNIVRHLISYYASLYVFNEIPGKILQYCFCQALMQDSQHTANDFYRPASIYIFNISFLCCVHSLVSYSSKRGFLWTSSSANTLKEILMSLNNPLEQNKLEKSFPF